MKNLMILLLGIFLNYTPLIAGISVVNGLSHVHNVMPGDTIRGMVELINQGTQSVHVKIFKNDYSYNEEGQSFFQIGGNKRSNLSWIELGITDIKIKAGQTYTFPYELVVPDSLKFQGSYWSVLMIEPVDTEDQNSLKNNQAVGIKSKFRYAVQVICNYNERAISSLDFKNAKIQKEETSQVLIDLFNNGDLYLKVKIFVEFYHPETGEQAIVLSSVKQSLHPDNCKRFIIDISKIPQGKYQALVLAKCDDGNVYGMHADIAVH
jgi:hypothetical protein